MAEYLERESILNAIRKSSNLYVDQQGLYLSCELIAEMPAADVQPVVRCKDCIERPHCQTHSDDFYCAFGERSDSND